ncbi:DnaJ-domain-containing protein [Dendrothele bispora CBS 962.96]|uniref:DnaJ-domain-containing protein n=1 Tax=Dendrothele bispora (strain CBS 962.96) TaxID=1314807 RepID=A0A4S8M8V1_DENBC|nr:DnaJ-domain-containing protein [Dendrothele bispora CBS 962.96]
MSTLDEDINPYELLSVKPEATEQEIRKAYRQRSLKVHPDRNPNNPDAAKQFHELTQASELLLDPLRRLALDTKLRAKQARAERFKGYDNKRKHLLEELEEREREFKKSRVEKQKQEAAQFQEAEKIKEEGRRMVEEKQKRMEQELEEQKEKQRQAEQELQPPALEPTDTTIRIKWTVADHPDLSTPQAIASLFSSFGEIDTDSIVLSLKSPKKAPQKPPKSGTALIPFKKIGDAFAAVCASGSLKGIEVGWIGGKEPQILGWLQKIGKLGSSGTTEKSSSAFKEAPVQDKAGLPQAQTGGSSTYSSFPSSFPDFSSTPAQTQTGSGGLDYESLTLMRMRQAERQRLEREILEQEAKES